MGVVSWFPAGYGVRSDRDVIRVITSAHQWPVKVWLDDLRPAPEGWVQVMTVGEAIALLESGRVDEMSLDHDLGLVDDQGREQTGHDVLLWLEREVAARRFVPPVLHVHSANPPAHERMLRAISAIERRSRGASGSETAG